MAHKTPHRVSCNSQPSFNSPPSTQPCGNVRHKPETTQDPTSLSKLAPKKTRHEWTGLHASILHQQREQNLESQPEVIPRGGCISPREHQVSPRHIPVVLPTPTKAGDKRAASERGSLTLRQACSLEKPGSAMCVQNFDDSRGLAIRITYRISLRPSSLWEPRHPLLKVVKWFGNSNPEARPAREGTLIGYSSGQSGTGHTIR